MRITLVVGARPNFVKVAPILAAMRDHPELRPTLVHTGQHHDALLSEVFFRDLEIPAPAANLGVEAGSGAAQVAAMLGRLAALLDADPPDLVLVVGDVNSTLAGALAAAKLGLPLAHVEAGLRSFDRGMPEEVNRVLTDAVADLCFTSEPSANENLAREGVPPERIHHVGNVMIDTLFRFRERAAASPVLRDLGLAPRGYAVLTLHRPGNVDRPEALRETLAAVAPVARECPVVFPLHPRTRARLESTGRLPGALRPVPSLPYLDFDQLVAEAACVLTDSGGVQEETTALGVPCLTLRSNTERPVTVTAGTNRLVGRDAERVAAAWREIRSGAWPAGSLPPLWDGKAAHRIVQVIRERGPR